MEYNLKLSGSGNGISSILPWFGCSLQASFNQERTSPESLTFTKEGKYIGMLYHAFLDIYFSKGERFNPTLVKFVSSTCELSINEDCRIEAERLFLHYQEDHFTHSSGEVISTEEHFTIDSSVFNQPGLTAQIDKVTRVLESHLPNIERQYGLRLTPGIYSWDYKQHGRQDSTLIEQYLNSIQGFFYQKVLQHKYGDGYKGHIFDVCIRTKSPRCFCIYQELIDEPQSILIDTTVARGLALRFAPIANPTRCYDWGRLCSYFNTCSRY